GLTRPSFPGLLARSCSIPVLMRVAGEVLRAMRSPSALFGSSEPPTVHHTEAGGSPVCSPVPGAIGPNIPRFAVLGQTPSTPRTHRRRGGLVGATKVR